MRALVAVVVTLALPVVACALALIAIGYPGHDAISGVLLFLGLAILADLKPVPLDERRRSSASLAFVFILAGLILYGWEVGVLVATTSVLVSQVAERRPLVRCLFNCAVYALAAFVAALPLVTLGIRTDAGTVTLTAVALVAGAAFVAVNVVLVALAVALHQRIPLRSLLRDDFREAVPVFVVMAFLAALAVALWRSDPVLLVLLAGPLFALALYQRSALASRIALRDAHTDSLTGLGNHRAYEQALAGACGAASPANPVALCLVDLDDLKLLNDVYGHPRGDRSLVALADALAAAGGARAYRIGGDEFALLLDGDGATAVAAVDVVRRRAAAFGLPAGGVLTVSAGVAECPRHGSAPDELERAADAALYRAKEQKNRTCLHEPAAAPTLTQAELDVLAERRVRLRAARKLVRVLDARDPHTARHSQAVSELAAGIGRALGREAETVEQLALAGLLHDLGKVAIPDRILRKAGPLDDREQHLVRTHPELGFTLLDGLGVEPVDIWVRHHHEHWDGSGYPSGLRGEAIPFGSRVVLVADAFEVMTSGRAYRAACTVDDALTELRRLAGTQFDPLVVGALVFHLGREDAAGEADARGSRPAPAAVSS